MSDAYTVMPATPVFLTLPAPSHFSALRFVYKNYRGEVAHRAVIVRECVFGTSKYHPEPQWLMYAFDVEKKASRWFAMRDMTEVKTFAP